MADCFSSWRQRASALFITAAATVPAVHLHLHLIMAAAQPSV
jgi:hypothetical protein